MKIQITILLMFCFFTAFSQEEEQETKILKGKSNVKTKMDFNLKGFNVGIYPSANAIIGPISKYWGSKNEGIGFFQGFGGDIEIGKALNYKNIALITIGREKWAVSRRMIANDVVINKTESQLNSIPLQFGVKHITDKMLFISPTIGFQFMKLTSTNNDNIVELIGKQSRVSGKFKIGKQKSLKFGKIEFGTQYRFIYSNNFFGINNSIHQLGIFTGITI